MQVSCGHGHARRVFGGSAFVFLHGTRVRSSGVGGDGVRYAGGAARSSALCEVGGDAAAY